MQDLYQLGQTPPTGQVPKKMLAQVIRQDRFGDPTKAFQVEEVDTPAELEPDEVLVCVMAAGINYNNVWAGLGSPVDVIKARAKDRRLGAVPHRRQRRVGRRVEGRQRRQRPQGGRPGRDPLRHVGSADGPVVKAGGDPMFDPSFRIWGYETNWGSFAQFTRVQAHQCLPKPKQLSWDAAAAYMLVGATAYRMLTNWKPHDVRQGDVVLIWGGTGGLGCQAIQIVKAFGGIPVAVVSSDDKFEFCKRSAPRAASTASASRTGACCRTGRTRRPTANGRKARAPSARRCGRCSANARARESSSSIRARTPSRRRSSSATRAAWSSSAPGPPATTPSSTCATSGCGRSASRGRTSPTIDDARKLNELVLAGKVDPCLSETFPFDEIPHVHQLMYENRHPHGNMACLVNAPKPGLTTL